MICTDLMVEPSLSSTKLNDFCLRTVRTHPLSTTDEPTAASPCVSSLLTRVRGVLSTLAPSASGASGASGAAGGLAAAGGAAAGGLAFFCSLAGGAAAPSSGGSNALSRSSSVTAADTSGDLLPSPSSLSRRTSLPCASTAATTSSGDMQARTVMLRLASRGKSTEAGDCGAARSDTVPLPRLAMAGSEFTPTRLATGSRATAELTRSSIRRQLARMQVRGLELRVPRGVGETSRQTGCKRRT